MIFSYKTMDTKPWNCCRTCLCEQTLYPIFPLSEYNDKYSDVIFTATGQKIELNDSLPQEMCSPCITFINQSYKFRKKCEETQNQLRSRFDNVKFQNVKVETSQIKQEATCIDISELLHDDDDFKDYDDNITLNSLQYFVPDKLDTETEQSKEIQHIEVLFNSKKSKNVSNKEEKPKRKLRSKKENKEVGKKERKGKKGDRERVREEIECEYCHKILTSKLSLRNHNKIHTGFDVVCEHCGKKFITRRLLLMHCRAKHGYEKTDKCSFCDYRASNAEQVKIHERLHTGEKPYVCKECGAGFHRKSSYLQHVAIHLPEKTVQCDQCPARFKSVTLMRIHKNRHRAPQYSFKCRVCDNSFARRRNVARHLQRIHGLPPDLQHIDRLKIG